MKKKEEWRKKHNKEEINQKIIRNHHKSMKKHQHKTLSGGKYQEIEFECLAFKL